MKEYKISIVGVTDFIIISPDVLGLLLQHIRESSERQMDIPEESIMPVGYTKYLEAVLNGNRDKKMFHFKQISEKELKKEHIYRILEHQMKNLKIEKDKCFEKFELLAENSEAQYTYSMESKKDFFYICQDAESRFTYVFPDGRQERITLSCRK